MTAAPRLRLLQGVALAVLLLLVAQLVRMQVIDARQYRLAASTERLRAVPVEAPRGLIYDRDGVLVGRNAPRFAVSVVPGDVPTEPAARRDALLRLERALGVPYTSIERAIEAGASSVDPFAPLTLLAGVQSEQAISLRAALAPIPGVHVEAAPAREYGGGNLLAHILGYVGAIDAEDSEEYLNRGYPLNAQVGRSGLELSYESQLRGTPGRALYVSDPAGRVLDTLGEVPAIPGADVILSIDLDLQRATTEALEAGIAAGFADPVSNAPGKKEPPTAAGAAVLMDVRTGELLALVSLPSFDANLFSAGTTPEEFARVFEDRNRPLVDRTYMEVKSPGSIFKPLVAAAALQEGVVTPHTQITSTGSISIQDEYNPDVRYIFRDWAAHGTMDLYRGIARSSDVYFYYLAGGYRQDGQQLFEGLGIERLAQYTRAAGFGTPTGIDLGGEADGLVPDPAWKEEQFGEPWVLGDTYTNGIGQGYLTVTPLQMTVLAAAIANGGELLQPRVVSALRGSSGLTPTARVVNGEMPIDDANLEVIREALRVTADPGGTALGGEPEDITIGGKTGTAEFGQIRPDGSFDTHGWFMGFAPYEDPEVAVIVYLQHGVGSTHAAPVGRRILEAYFAPRAPAVAR